LYSTLVHHVPHPSPTLLVLTEGRHPTDYSASAERRAAPTFWAASSSIAGLTCMYKSEVTVILECRMPNLNASDKPVRLLVTFDAAKEKQNPNAPQYTSNPPNFRISLACTK
jgi:hypothetical protein